MSIAIFDIPIPVVISVEGQEKQNGYAIYVESGGMFENDIWCIALEEGGMVRHFLSSQIRIFKNSTFSIKEENKP